MIDDRPPHPDGVALLLQRLRERLADRGSATDLVLVRARWVDDAIVPLVSDEPAAGVEIPQASRFARLLETGAQHLEIASAAAREQRRQAAIQARALAAFAAARPAAALDRPDDEVGAAAAASRAARPAALTAVSEWAVDEVMVALAMSSAAASNLLAQSVTLVEEFPATLAALEAGVIGPAHARMLTDVLAPLGPYLRGEVETRLLAGARGRTVAQLRASAKRAVLRADASAGPGGWPRRSGTGRCGPIPARTAWARSRRPCRFRCWRPAGRRCGAMPRSAPPRTTCGPSISGCSTAWPT